MKEITFLRQNEKKWLDYEEKLKEEEITDPAKVTDMFVELTDDLSYANSNYPDSRTQAYLNTLTGKVHQMVYKNRKESSSRFITFYTKELPSFFATYHKQLLISFIVFSTATLLGIISQLKDDSFVRLILGDYYVDSTIERIRNGNPLGIYGEENQFLMFVYITLNNIRVSFIAFVFGLLTAFGTSFFLVYNAVMLGSFFTLFYQHNALTSALKVVWIHGTLEISAIILAGCAGIVLGNSFIFPGTYTRMHAFKTAMKNGLKIIIGLIPVFILAGFLESFVTRYTEMHWLLSLSIIGLSLLFILFYFVYLPIYYKRQLIFKHDK
jgi:uncharacterized membrane protein SpoIIM required for sporulation